MRALPFLLALLVLAGCRFERTSPTLDADVPAAAEAPAAALPPADRPPPPGTQPPPPPEALTNPRTVDGKPEVVLYVTEWCPYCAQAREWMTAEGVPHRVVDIEKSEEGAYEYAARGGTGPIPLVAVGTQTMEGWSPAYAEQMLATAGYQTGD